MEGIIARVLEEVERGLEVRGCVQGGEVEERQRGRVQGGLEEEDWHGVDRRSEEAARRVEQGGEVGGEGEVEREEREVVEDLGHPWTEGIEKEAQELLEMIHLPLAGELVEVEYFACTGCDKKFSTERNLYFHYRCVHEGPCSCRLCKKEFGSKFKFDVHVKKVHALGPHLRPSPLQCHLCGLVINNKSNMWRHMKTVHQGTKPKKTKAITEQRFPCDRCGKVIKYKRNLARHKKKHQVDHKQRLPRSLALRNRQLCKSSAQSLSCHLCGQRFRRRPSLLLHLNIVHRRIQRRKKKQKQQQHEPSYSCPKCPKIFNSKKVLWKHKSRHHGRQWRCTACEKVFSESSNLRRHMAIHRSQPRVRRQQVTRQQQLLRMKNVVDEFKKGITGMGEKDIKRVFRMIIQQNPEVLERYSDNPLSEGDILEMVRDVSLSDRQALKVLAVVRRKWGRRAITPNIRIILKERKQIFSHLYSVEMIHHSDPLHFEDKNGEPISRYLVFCHNLPALAEAKELVEGEEYDSIIGIDDGKKLLKVTQFLKDLFSSGFLKIYLFVKPDNQVTWNSVRSGALPARGTPGQKEGRGVKYAQVVAAVKDCPESYNNLSVIVSKLQVIGFRRRCLF